MLYSSSGGVARTDVSVDVAVEFVEFRRALVGHHDLFHVHAGADGFAEVYVVDDAVFVVFRQVEVEGRGPSVPVDVVEAAGFFQLGYHVEDDAGRVVVFAGDHARGSRHLIRGDGDEDFVEVGFRSGGPVPVDSEGFCVRSVPVTETSRVQFSVCKDRCR